MSAAILLPTGLIRLSAERFFLAIADCLNAIGGDASSYERILDGAGAIVAQCQVVLRRTTLVAVCLKRKADARVLLQESDVRLNRGLLARADIRLVVIEIDILDALSEELLVC